MQRPRKSRLFFILGLLAIIILYSVYNLYVLDPPVFYSMTRLERHVLKFGAVIIAYAIGLFAYKRFWPDWLLQLWHILYACGLVVLILSGVYDGFMHEVSVSIRLLLSSIFEFLISPIPYVIVGIINSALKTDTPPGTAPHVPPTSPGER